MDHPYRHLDVRHEGDACCVRLRRLQFSEVELYAMCGELLRLAEQPDARKVVLNLGPPDPEFLYSVFLAKLVSVQKRLETAGGALRLVTASPMTKSIFAACRLDSHFHFAPDEATALRELAAPAAAPNQSAEDS